MDQYQNRNPEPFYVPNPYFAKYSQMGGWLLVFVIIFLFGLIPSCFTLIGDLSQLFFSFLLTNDYSGFDLLSQLFSLFISLLYLAPKTIAYINIMRKKGIFITILISYELVRILCVSFLVFLFYDHETIYSVIIVIITAPSILYNIIAIFYLTWSVRVRTYMGSDEYITKDPLMRLIRVKAPKPEAPYKAVHNSNPVFQSLLAPCQQTPMPQDQSQVPPAPPTS